MKKSPFVALAGNNSAISLMMLTFIGFWVFVGIYQLKPPNAAPTSAPLTEFSSGRAMKHLWVIAEKPHPPGSPEHAAVRDYILKQLIAMGLHPEVQRATVVNLKWIKTWSAPIPAGTVYNIVARLEGIENTKAILLVGHYDSVPSGPGASDDGAAVAAMLETLRALRAGSPLRNDVIFLFTDGDRSRFLRHPWHHSDDSNNLPVIRYTDDRIVRSGNGSGGAAP